MLLYFNVDEKKLTQLKKLKQLTHLENLRIPNQKKWNHFKSQFDNLTFLEESTNSFDISRQCSGMQLDQTTSGVNIQWDQH